MGQIENQWRQSLSRRQALLGLAGMFAGSSLLGAQQDPPSSMGGPLRHHPRALGIDEMVTSFDFEPVFQANVSRAAYDTVSHGSDGEWTRARNRQVFQWVDIVPRPAVDVSAVNASTEIFGVKMDYPIFISPTGSQGGTHPDAEAGMHGGGSAAKSLVILPNNTNVTYEKAAAAGPFPFFWQFYPKTDLEASRATLEQMQALGARAIVVTVDQANTFFQRSNENANLGGKPRVKPSAPAALNNPYRASKGRWWYDWKYLDQIRPFIKVPMLAKGVMTAKDAELCIQHGLDGIIVSNHGGRALDYVPASLEVLPEILDAVRGRIPVLTDSGYRRGTDIFKALALGAKAVGLGRASRWALGAYGAPGVQRLMEIMQKELAAAMAKAGRPTLASLDRTAVRTHFV